jgi:RHS repeat-associated protein
MSKGTSAMVAWTFDNRSADLSGTAELDQTRTHNAANEITDLSGTANDPTHDASGNMTADENHTYVYDAWNRLVEVRDRGDDSLIAEYEYDGQKRRIEKTVDSTTEDIFYNSEWQILEVRTADDTDPSEQYIWDIRYVDAPVLRFQDTNTDGTIDNTLYYTNDANMNVTALVDESGTVVERYAYDPYGERTVLDGDWSTDADGLSDVNNTLGHQGLYLDTESALYYNRNRYYSPTLGRFITRDPLGYVDGMSVYESVGGQVLTTVDDRGLKGSEASFHWKKVGETKYIAIIDGDEITQLSQMVLENEDSWRCVWPVKTPDVKKSRELYGDKKAACNDVYDISNLVAKKGPSVEGVFVTAAQRATVTSYTKFEHTFARGPAIGLALENASGMGATPIDTFTLFSYGSDGLTGMTHLHDGGNRHVREEFGAWPSSRTPR